MLQFLPWMIAGYFVRDAVSPRHSSEVQEKRKPRGPLDPSLPLDPEIDEETEAMVHAALSSSDRAAVVGFADSISDPADPHGYGYFPMAAGALRYHAAALAQMAALRAQEQKAAASPRVQAPPARGQAPRAQATPRVATAAPSRVAPPPPSPPQAPQPQAPPAATAPPAAPAPEPQVEEAALRAEVIGAIRSANGKAEVSPVPSPEAAPSVGAA